MASEQHEISSQAPLIVQPRISRVPKPRHQKKKGSSLRDEQMLFRIVGAVFITLVLLGFGFAIGQQYTMSQVETTREAGMKIQFERSKGIKNLFDSLVGEPEVKQPIED